MVLYLLKVLFPEFRVDHKLLGALLEDISELLLGKLSCDVISGNLWVEGFVSDVNSVLLKRFFRFLIESLSDLALSCRCFVQPKTNLIGKSLVVVLCRQKSVLYHVKVN